MIPISSMEVFYRARRNGSMRPEGFGVRYSYLP